MTEATPKRQRLSERQRIAWLRLIRSDNVGPATFRGLIARFGSAEAALEALPELGRKGGSRMIRIASTSDAQRELEAAERLNIRIVAIGEPDYPPLLRRMENAPPLVAIKGDAAAFSQPCIAMVGTRNASAAGARMARMLASELGAEGFSIASGLARGIDTAAHQGSFETGTIAVLAGGLDRPYPPENVGLSARIAEGKGALISEMPLGWEPRARDFPRRNRIIAGLAYGLVVVEAAERSGSLISARLANEIGRLVFAVPGSPLDNRAKGSNGLLKDGAILVTETDDILRQIAPLLGRPIVARETSAPIPDLTDIPLPSEDARTRLIESLSPVPMPVDDIVVHSGLSPAEVHLILLELDLAGKLERHSGGAVSLVQL